MQCESTKFLKSDHSLCVDNCWTQDAGSCTNEYEYPTNKTCLKDGIVPNCLTCNSSKC